ncbi:MAG: YlxR family protein [Oscillospiraceae bacterium]|nr:YlxR family protein [Oscillospiraceae bacterium]
MEKKRKVPIRRCIGCGEHKEKRGMIRVVRAPEKDGGEITLDPTGKKNGRGAYLCPQEECLKRAIKRRAISYAFKCKVENEVYAALEEQLTAINAANPAE